MQVSVVNSYEATLLTVVVDELKKVLLPTDGKPTRDTLARPDFGTANPTPFSAEVAFRSASSLLSFISLARRRPR